MTSLVPVPQAVTVPEPADPSTPAGAPALFRDTVAALEATALRREVRLSPLRAPQRLAPWSHAVAADVLGADGIELATGRLVLLHDPDGEEAWDGLLRLVAYASAEIDPEIGVDILLPTVGWSWLTEALTDRGATYRAAGGTVTQTNSTRFGDIAGPVSSVSIEIRASWTADDTALDRHLLAFADLLCTAAGLPPEGVAVLSNR
ncbi:MAG: DUF3000 domain-containing protein [Jatrophihabitans sp.]|uniref:DUF3000 domain-containing protein n=1 Tax=Jatrophihabitans sp. TaxID=1932789 RepID=UPI003F7E84C8